MHFDALTLACIAHELGATVADGRVQQAVMIDDQSVGLEIYANQQRRYLLLSADRQTSRVHLTDYKLRRGTERQPPFFLLLRKYVRGARLDRVLQPDFSERVLRLCFDHPEHGATTLVTEPMGRHANLLLLGPDDKILDVLFRSAPEGSGRALLPNKPYTMPPPQDKIPPLDDGSRDDYYERLAAIPRETGKLWQALVRQVAGLSPSQAREVARRAGGAVDAPAQAASTMTVLQALQELWEPVRTGRWQPGTWEEAGAVVGFSPYPAQVRGTFVPQPSMSLALERFYASRSGEDQAQAADSVDAYAALRGSVAADLRRAEQRLHRQLEAMAGDEPEPGEVDGLRRDAEWLLALSSQIEPGQETLEVDLGDEVLTISLEDRQSPVGQAQAMFKRAAKLERAARIIPVRRARLQGDLEQLAQLRNDLALAENQPEIVGVQEELRRMGLLSTRTGRKRPKAGHGQTGAPRRFESTAGFEILVGRNARQNELVTFKLSHPEDLWLHVRDAPGSHVVVRRRGGEVDEETIRLAAQLAGYFSSRRGERSVDVAVTQCRFISRLRGGHTGQVTLRQDRTVTVPAELPQAVRALDE